jgi:activator of HSP90 ATPase
MATVQQDVVFDVPPAKVYEALVDAEVFSRWTDAPAEIDASAGGAFRVFGPYIQGRNVELVEATRVVQAWRSSNWEDGVYSVARFELVAEGAGTRLRFEQHGVPEDALEHIQGGWKAKYWDPMAAYFAAGTT